MIALGGTSVLVAGGLIAGDGSTAAAYRLDLSSGHTANVGSLPVPVHDTAGALTPGGRALVLGGGNSTEQDVVQAYDPSSGTWSVIGRLPQARSDLTVTRSGRQLFAVGGYDGTRPAEPSVLTSRDGTTWRVAGSLPDPVRYPATAVSDGVLWVFGGERSGQQRDSVQRVDLLHGRSSVVAHLPHALGHATAIAFGTKVLLVGGRLSNGNISEQCWWFDTGTRRFVRAGRLPWPLADSAAVSVGATTYLLGGETPSLTSRVVRLRIRPAVP